MSLPKEVEDRLSVFQNTEDQDMELHNKAVRFIQDSEFVSPGEIIRLTYHDAIKTFKAGYRAALEAARSMPSEKDIEEASEAWAEDNYGFTRAKSEGFVAGAAWLKSKLESKE